MTALCQWAAADAARAGRVPQLISSLQTARQRTLDLLAAFEDGLGPALRVPFSTQLNPPLWEAGHVGWFQDYWIARNRQRALGIAADPDHPRPPGRLPDADALYNSSVVAQTVRWQLPLPDLDATRAYLAAGLAETLGLLGQTAATPADLYFFWLVLFHEQMHGEAATYMAQALDISLPEALRPQAPQVLQRQPGSGHSGHSVEAVESVESTEWQLPDVEWAMGYDGPGFAFDNELHSHRRPVAAFAIDSLPVSWERYLPFATAAGYSDPRCWSAAGWQWRAANAVAGPRYLRQANGQWQQRRFGGWQALPLAAPAVHLSWFEADAWCRWAGRRLPSEAEWEYAAHAALCDLGGEVPTHDAGFHWGEVWEWTASRFLPYPGFRAHPYRDYSAPWFDSRYVLRGASGATAPEMAHPRYRNFFAPERNDLHCGFRSCALKR
ncbi:MAG TPA: hypothetical protein DHV85_15030 [Candidatus Accumulibacter sp.]|nr:hypothetical protein [Accumulibacter sp.]